jgi:hypothetical protein
MKKILVLFLFTLLAVVAFPQAKADTTGDVTGTFSSTGYNNAVDIDSENLVLNRVTWDAVGDAETGTVTTALTPQLNYYAEFDVSDLDGFDDLVVEFQFFYYDEGTEVSPQTDFENNAATDTDAFIVKWFGANGMVTGDAAAGDTTGFVSDMGATSWLDAPIQEGEDPVSYYASVVSGTATSKTFKIYFSPSKVAPASSTGHWTVGIEVYDYIGETDWVHGTSTADQESFEAVTGFTMDWYGEVTHNAASIAWNSATAGMTYGTGADSQQEYTDMTFISNANYYQEVKASEIWTQTSGAVNQDATLKAAPTGTNQFGLRAYTYGDWVGVTEQGTPELSGSYTQVSHVDLANIGGVYYARTGESGVTGTIRIQLALSDNFQNGTYEGTITFGITNYIPA